ncbi:MAG TPA: 16S rRNA (cytidine(1402)-2'-O)-methyltransferase [Kofleriaceae bacterium]|nr:16S rRNA (cytidine(1402)-2'-O)-methyltransferase [Kofleriaceae bacterium]
MSERAGILYLVATPIGNLEDMTYRAVRVLREANVVACEDTRRTSQLLRHFEIEAARLVSYFEGNEAARTDELLAQLEAGASVALCSDAGTPGISDPGERLVARAVAAGVRVEVVPGAVAAVVALVASGLSTERFLFLGFPPRKEGARRELFGTLRCEAATMIFYEAPDRMAATLADLAAALGGARRAAVARELTKLHEEIARGTLDELHARYASQGGRGEHTLVVAGASEAEREAAREPFDLEAAVRALLATGLGPKDVAARLVPATGLPRRAIYQLALSLADRKEQP